MDKLTGLTGAGIATILGILGLIFWWDFLIVVLKGGIPIILLMGGIISLAAALSELKESKKDQEKKSA